MPDSGAVHTYASPSSNLSLLFISCSLKIFFYTSFLTSASRSFWSSIISPLPFTTPHAIPHAPSPIQLQNFPGSLEDVYPEVHQRSRRYSVAHNKPLTLGFGMPDPAVLTHRLVRGMAHSQALQRSESGLAYGSTTFPCCLAYHAAALPSISSSGWAAEAL